MLLVRVKLTFTKRDMNLIVPVRRRLGEIETLRARNQRAQFDAHTHWA